jgi:fumarylacetoacetase
MQTLDFTHDPGKTSWVESANGHPDFPLQNLPLGRFALADGQPRVGVAIGDHIVDLASLRAMGLLSLPGALDQELEALLASASDALGWSAAARLALRHQLFHVLDGQGPQGDAARRRQGEFLRASADCALLLPSHVRNYSDFNAGIYHSARGGLRRGRPMAEALLPNYRHVPIGYHGRASSVQPSGTAIRRPWGQIVPAGASQPVFEPSRKLDFELELGIWIGSGNSAGQPIPVGQAAAHIAGYSLLNDWSARDIQSWESERLGPFLGKSFGTTVSPWVITPEALAPFRLPAFTRAATDPQPLDYLLDAADQAGGGLNLELAVHLQPAGAADTFTLSRSHARHLYWTPAQMLAHQASNGCNLQVGDVLGTGTISGPDADNFGTLIDAYDASRSKLSFGGFERSFLLDGDQVMLEARAHREGRVSIGFGPCRGQILPAVSR